jgi:hypothetical protein
LIAELGTAGYQRKWIIIDKRRGGRTEGFYRGDEEADKVPDKFPGA